MALEPPRPKFYVQGAALVRPRLRSHLRSIIRVALQFVLIGMLLWPHAHAAFGAISLLLLGAHLPVDSIVVR